MSGEGLAGSMHKLSDGYGYGARIPTHRNKPTFPITVPTHRYPQQQPDSKQQSTKLIMIDARAQLRHNDQLKHQSSGEWGRFFFDTSTEAIRLNSQPLKSITTTQRPHTVIVTEPTQIQQGRNYKKSVVKSSPFGGSNFRGCGPPLDQTFSKHTKYDLLASTTPSKSEAELQNCMHANEFGYHKARPWTQTLRGPMSK